MQIKSSRPLELSPAEFTDCPQLAKAGVGVEKVTEISGLNGGKSVVEEGELSLPCFAGSPFSEAR